MKVGYRGLVVAAGLFLGACAGLSAVDRKYDRFTDETRILLNPIALEVLASDQTSTPQLTLEAQFTSPGLLNVNRPETVTLALQSKAAAWQFQERRALTLWVDGEALTLGSLGHDGTTRSGYRVEYLWAKVPVELFMRIVTGKQVIGQLGDYRFTLHEDALAKLQDFAKRIPDAPRP